MQWGQRGCLWGSGEIREEFRNVRQGWGVREVGIEGVHKHLTFLTFVQMYTMTF